ncbi:small-conductance mechanosensitive channel [Paraburkholderia sp. GAS41]|uniref:conjugal transfer protein TrbC n=1 Tax=Paraburkholderia sp. GAS41 TaxID=3035134 RepID=UPI003D232BA6
MKSTLKNLSVRLHTRAFSAAKFLFGRKEIRSTLVAVALASVAPMASAVDMSDLGSATGIVCLISAYISGPWLYAIGVVLIIVGAVAIGNSESTIGKMISTVFVGLGLASVAIPIVKNHLMINYTCS